MKAALVVIAVLFSGCSESKFKYGDCVEVTHGFYKGYSGYVYEQYVGGYKTKLFTKDVWTKVSLSGSYLKLKECE